MTTQGKVYLVGGGPGDPGLLTVRAQSLMKQVDVVAYDALISPALLSMVPEHVEMVAIGYRGYHNSINYGMHPEVIEMALAGKNVLRLKAGDPFIFGRGTQECDDLIAHNIPFEVVPGISSALGASAYAGFPLTSIGIASEVTFASGHHCGKGAASWKAMAQGSGTLALYMAAKRIRDNFSTLIREGRSADTPAIYISGATTSRHYELEGTLTTLPDKVEELNITDPALVIVGDVISLRDRLHWRKLQPLSGKRVLLSVDGANGEQLRMQLENLGGTVIQMPAPRYLNDINESDWSVVMNSTHLVFRDQQSVIAWQEALVKHNVDIRTLKQTLSVTTEVAQQALQAMCIMDVGLLSESDLVGLDAGTTILAGAPFADAAELPQPREGVNLVRAYLRVPARLRFDLPECDIVILDSEESYAALGDNNNAQCLKNARIYTCDHGLHQRLEKLDIPSTCLNFDDALLNTILAI